MGNHDVGKAFAATFESIDVKSISREEILKHLDSVGDKFRGTDAEFDDYTDSSHPLGQALIKVFAPDDFPTEPSAEATQEECDDWDNLWWEKVYEPFKKRYGFW